MPQDAELHAYAQSLPDIYREILAAFPRIEPGRQARYGLAFQTIAADFQDRGKRFTLGEVIQACERLRDKRLVEIKHGIFVHPTEYGERLIAIITGRQPADVLVPTLPSPPA